MKIEIQGELIEVFIKGSYLEKDKNAVAIVGSRITSERGQELAYRFSFSLAKRGITIISGLARGIDTIAHRAALAAGGRTIAILGHGLDRIYPSENRDLALKIIKSGCLITKFREGTRPYPSNFLARNQIIAGLSKAVLVIEGQRKSGSISTANHAANLGVEVFAIPGSPATDWLLENGASVASEVGDVLGYLGIINYTKSY